MVWDDEIICNLRELWAHGLSTAEIGRRLGVSKNAIVGKAHRLELDARPSPIRRDVVKLATQRSTTLARVAGPTLPPLASATVRPPGPLPANVQPLRALPDFSPSRPAPGPAASAPTAMAPSAMASNAVVSKTVVFNAVAPTIMVAPRPMQPAPMPARRSAPTCCWPIGEPGTKAFRFCDDASLAGKPYCDEHVKLAYVRVRDRKEDAA